MTTQRLALFPLPIVLFPRAQQHLHIFEPRYRRLLVDVLAGNREFGMLFHSPGLAERDIPPGTVGCTAHVETTEALPDGRSNIVVTGRRRFSLRRFVDDDTPYFVGEVEFFDDNEEPESDASEIARCTSRLRSRNTSISTYSSSRSCSHPVLQPHD